jgi:hypothetical protein
MEPRAPLEAGEATHPRHRRKQAERMIASKKIKKYFLVLASSTIFVVALLYGVSPHWFAATFLGVSQLDLNLAHILRAFMCLYLGFGLFWLFAAFSDKYRNTAVLTAMLFPAGLVVGRIISFLTDGRPAPLLLFYLFAELIQAPVAYWVFRLPE